MDRERSFNPTILDRVIGYLSPERQLQRLRARVMVDRATELLARHYEAAARGRRTEGWNRSTGDANAVIAAAMGPARAIARDLRRNNPYTKRGLRSIANHTVGWGIVPTWDPPDPEVTKVWQEWAETTACDADGRNDFYGLQKLVCSSVAESGEVLVRRRLRLRPEDADLPLPLQLQVLEPDYLDTERNAKLENGGRIVNGVELDVIGRRIAYWLFREHPGASVFGAGYNSVRVPAEGIIHVYLQERPGQLRGMTWLSTVILTLKKFDQYADAQLEKQVVAAMLAAIVTDPDGTSLPLGTVDPEAPTVDRLEAGAIIQGPPGRDVTMTQPPSTSEYRDYSEVTLRGVAAGMGNTYEDTTGDYTNLPFSAARLSRLAHWDDVHDWQWQMLIPQFCVPAHRWAMEVAAIKGRVEAVPKAKWTPPPMPMADPVNEGLAYARNVRAGIQSLSEAIRERGYDPETLLRELAEDMRKLDKLGLVLDSDPRKTTQQGMIQTFAEPQEPKDPNATAGAAAAGDDGRWARPAGRRGRNKTNGANR